ncbi:MAG TPA: sigma factor-like helix-turn-helix DNA-binding protein [Clostridiales bacterium]|nr:sigma factor-like helix-turn-helix DNA-binding protein [Clostridiales bacterium]
MFTSPEELWEIFFIEVTDKLAELLILFGRKDHADYKHCRVYRAYYSLDANDGIEMDFTLLVMSPEEIYERKLSRQELYAAINSLLEKQAKRIYAHFFLNMSKTEIARIEGVERSSVRNSIARGLKQMEKYLKNLIFLFTPPRFA